MSHLSEMEQLKASIAAHLVECTGMVAKYQELQAALTEERERLAAAEAALEARNREVGELREALRIVAERSTDYGAHARAALAPPTPQTPEPLVDVLRRIAAQGFRPGERLAAMAKEALENHKEDDGG